MDPQVNVNPIASLSKAEIVRRSLDFLFIPLQYYVSEMLLRSYPKEEVAKMLEKRPGRVGDVSHLLELCFRHKKEFAEVAPVLNEASIARQVRNCWAHSEPIDDLVMLKFLISCETITAAICTEENYLVYEHLRSLRQCWLLLQAEKTLEEFTSYDALGNTMLTYPALLPPWSD